MKPLKKLEYVHNVKQFDIRSGISNTIPLFIEGKVIRPLIAGWSDFISSTRFSKYINRYNSKNVSEPLNKCGIYGENTT